MKFYHKVLTDHFVVVTWAGMCLKECVIIVFKHIGLVDADNR